MSASGAWRQDDNRIPVARLARMDEARLRVAAIIDHGALLQAVADEARAITGAQYSAVQTSTKVGVSAGLAVSGFTPEGSALQDILSGQLDLGEHLALLATTAKAAGTAQTAELSRTPASQPKSAAMLEAPVLRQDESLGSIFAAGKAGGGHLTQEDERILSLFAPHAAAALSNALAFHAEQQARKRLERLILTLGESLRKPLSAIKGSTALALGTSTWPDPAETQQFFRIIDRQTDQMRSLINDLLDVVRADADMLPITVEPVYVADLVKEAKASFLSRSPKSSVNVALPPELLRIRADRRRLVQALNILFFGVSGYGSEGSCVNVSAFREGGQVAISVLGHKAAAPAERLLPQFHWVFRFGKADERLDTEGTCLGFSVCKRIVEAHGGRIWADSAGPGQGAGFAFTVPVAGGAWDDAAAEVPPETGSDALPVQARILVIDNDRDVLEYVRRTLSAAGYAPCVTESVEEAGRIMDTEMPSLILLDSAMLPATGTELAQDISGDAGVPVILMSWRGWDQDAVLAFERGIWDFISKPFSQIELVTRVRAALRRRVHDEVQPLEPYACDGLRIEYAGHNVSVYGRNVQLTATEYNLLVVLSSNAGRVLSHQRLLERVWGPGQPRDQRVLRAFVKSLRRKLGDDAANPSYIFTVPRVGYRMAKPSKSE